VENKWEDLAATAYVAVQVAVEEVVNVNLGFGRIIDWQWDGEGLGDGQRNGGGFQEWGRQKLDGVWGKVLLWVPAQVTNKVVG
jgi:hypothetical protein